MIASLALPRLSDRDRRTLVRGGVSIAAVLILGKGVPAYRGWVRDTAQARTEELADETRATALIAAVPSLRDSLRARSTRALALAPAILDGNNPAAAAATLASLIGDAATDADVSLGALEPRSDARSGVNGSSATAPRGHVLAPVSVHGTLTGDVVGVSQFLSDLEHGPQLLSVRDLTISQSDPGAGSNEMETLHAEFTVVGLARAQEPGAKATRRNDGAPRSQVGAPRVGALPETGQ